MDELSPEGVAAVVRGRLGSRDRWEPTCASTRRLLDGGPRAPGSAEVGCGELLPEIPARLEARYDAWRTALRLPAAS